MGKSTVRMDGAELKKLQEQIMLFGDPTKMDQFLQACTKELAARLLRKVIKRTPVGNYSGDPYTGVDGKPKKGNRVPGKMGGTLRRGWTSASEEEAMYSALFGADDNTVQYVQSMPIKKSGPNYIIEIVNPVEYASYVEYGHRTPSHRGWVEGQFFLTISEKEIRDSAPAILEKKLEKYLRKCFKV